jgi:hypothetical protein
LRHDLDQFPALGFAERASFTNPYHITDFAGVLLIVGVELVRGANNLAVQRVWSQIIHRHDDGLVHLVADHPADLKLSSSFGQSFPSPMGL